MGKHQCQGTLHVCTCPHRGIALSPQLLVAVVPTATYGELHPGSSRVPVYLHNLSTCAIEVPTKTIMGQMVSCLPIKYLQWLTTWPGLPQRPNTQHKRDGFLVALDLQGLKEWPESEQKHDQGAVAQMGAPGLHTATWILGKSALAKHKIKLTDQMPFKEHYRHIPLHMYDDVRAHIQEMLDISAIHWLHSPWASTVVLVHGKQDGGLRFCIRPQEA